jgi:hypothetical protein
MKALLAALFLLGVLGASTAYAACPYPCVTCGPKYPGQCFCKGDPRPADYDTQTQLAPTSPGAPAPERIPLEPEPAPTAPAAE